MCGILGAVGAPDAVQQECLVQGLTALAHRGPDDSGWQLIHHQVPQPTSVFLGNRRLAILDLSPAAHQPMEDRETGNWIVYNGEIYNFQEIRSELQADGTVFTSRSDTEVILKAYVKWGSGCLDHFRGMFAIAIWDARARALFLARDRFGEKPLYYFHSDSFFIFASEVRSLLRTGLVARTLDKVGLLDFLRYGSVSDPDTLIRGVRCLPPAHCLWLKNGKASIRKYWDLDNVSPQGAALSLTGHAEAQRIDELRSQLEDAILLRTVSDVPVGIFLSGGIDSSSLVALLSGKRPSSSTFSVVFRESDYSEAQYSRSVSKRFGTDHHEIVISGHEVMNSVQNIISAMDQPTIDGVNTYIISRETRRMGYKVALSGLGADEIFAGYGTFKAVPRMEWIASWANSINPMLRHLLAFMIRAPIYKHRPRAEKLAALIRDNQNVSHPYTLARTLFMPHQLEQLISTCAVDADRTKEPLAQTAKWAERFDAVNRTSYLELRHYMANTLLRDSDCMAMAHGLELRVPFLDHKLAEFMFRIPGRDKIKSGISKWLLVEAMRGALPSAIVNRPKRGFTFPFEVWLKKEMRRDMEEVLSDESANLAAGLDRKFVTSVWKDFMSGKTTWSRPWSLYVLKSWVTAFLESPPAGLTVNTADLTQRQALTRN